MSLEQRLQNSWKAAETETPSENRNSPGEERQQSYDEPIPTSTKGSTGISTITGEKKLKKKKKSDVYKVTKTPLLVVSYEVQLIISEHCQGFPLLPSNTFLYHLSLPIPGLIKSFFFFFSYNVKTPVGKNNPPFHWNCKGLFNPYFSLFHF